MQPLGPLRTQCLPDIRVDDWCSCLVLAAVGFAGECTRRQDWSLGCFHSSHSRSRCTATAVLVPDFSRSVPTDLCCWLCEHSTWGTPVLIACIPTAEAGPRAVPTTVCFVSPHNGWQVTPQSPLLSGQLRWRNTQWLLSQKECYSPAYLTVHLRNGPGGFYSNIWRAKTLLLTGLWQPQRKEEALKISTAGSLWSPQQQSHPLTRG